MRCVGPIASLKNRYGQGYKLDVRVDLEKTDTQTVLAYLQKKLDGVTVEEDEPPSLTLTVPKDSAPLSRLFGELAIARQQLNVQECSVTQTTLEQVFLMSEQAELAREHLRC